MGNILIYLFIALTTMKMDGWVFQVASFLDQVHAICTARPFDYIRSLREQHLSSSFVDENYLESIC
jgi:hypothetical protein